jgi:hypothetical protein
MTRSASAGPVTVIGPLPWLSNVTSPIFDLTIQLKDQLWSDGYICSLALALSAIINHQSTGEKLRAILWHPPALVSLSPHRQPYLWSNLCTCRNVWILPLRVLKWLCWNSTTQRVLRITHGRSIVPLHSYFLEACDYTDDLSLSQCSRSYCICAKSRFKWVFSQRVQYSA